MNISKFYTEKIDALIDDYCSANGISLPVQYKEFLKKYNGGLVVNTNFKINGVSSDIRAFYGLGDVKYSLNNVNILEAGEKMYLPVAVDSFGNNITISLSDGNMFFMNHERDNALVSLECDFNSFVSVCESKGINPNALKSVEEREADLISRGRGNIITDDLRKMWRKEIEKYKDIILEEVVL